MKNYHYSLLALVFCIKPLPGYADGATLYKERCFLCHDTGLVNAPRLGDRQQWQARKNKGMDILVNTVIHGKGAMPPRGGSQYSDQQIKLVVEFMLSKVK